MHTQKVGRAATERLCVNLVVASLCDDLQSLHGTLRSLVNIEMDAKVGACLRPHRSSHSWLVH